MSRASSGKGGRSATTKGRRGAREPRSGDLFDTVDETSGPSPGAPEAAAAETDPAAAWLAAAAPGDGPVPDTPSERAATARAEGAAPPVVLVDGSAYLYRAFRVMERQGRELSTSDGRPTEAVYTVVNMLRKLAADYRPEIMAAVFDASGGSFRDELYADYKANREAMPERLREQVEPLHDLIRALGMPLLVVEGVEADDVIGTLAVAATAAGRETVVSTGDKDMAQLVDEHVTLVNTMSDTVTDVAGVVEKFGVRPDQIADYLALVGDTSDNIPGVPSCGPKTAAKWLAEHGDLDTIIARADTVKGKIGEKLRASLDQLPLSRTLATIRTDVPLPTPLEALRLAPPDIDALARLYDALEFRGWRRELDEGVSPLAAGAARTRGRSASAGGTAGAGAGDASDEPVAARPARANGDGVERRYETILAADVLERWLAELESAELVAFDTETTSLDYMRAEIVGVSFATGLGRAAYVPLAHVRAVEPAPASDGAAAAVPDSVGDGESSGGGDTDADGAAEPDGARGQGGGGTAVAEKTAKKAATRKKAIEPAAEPLYEPIEQLDRETVLERLRPWLEGDARNIVGQHLKYDMNVLANHGVTLRNVAHDTMLESYVLDSTASRHNMDALALRHLGITPVKFEDIAGRGKRQLSFDKVALEEAAHYAAEDADLTLRLHRVLRPELEKEPALERLYAEMELPLVPVLSRMERAGVRVDARMLARQGEELERTIDATREAAYAEAGREFNLGSPKQIGEIFFEEKKYPVIAKTRTGQPSTAENVLEQLALDHALPRLILEHRGLSKLKSTYIDRLPEQIDPATGRVHTSYHQAVTSTGRLSSSEPNLQNIPVRTEEGRRIREAFVAEKGYRLLAADYSQIELRIMAHLSADEGLLGAFDKGLDVHRATAAEVFGVALDEVEDGQRRAAKTINFGLIYGMSSFGLAKQLDIPRGEAQNYISRYFERYPGVRRYMEETRGRAKDRGYVETVFGRRLHLPDINSSNGSLRQYAERTAINAPMQGTAADIIKRAMIDVDGWLIEKRIDARLIMQVHDELVLEVRKGELDEVGEEVARRMRGAASLAVPLEVDVGAGDSWEEAH